MIARIITSIFFVLAVATCSTVWTQTVPTIQGVLLKSDGRPRPYTEIELVPVGAEHLIIDSRLISASGTNGKFTFYDVPPGRYTLSINFDDRPTELSPYDTYFYPLALDRESAEMITIEKATRLKNLVFKLPRELTLRTVKGRVVWDDDGSPAMNVYLGFWDMQADKSLSFGGVKIDLAGNFTVKGFDGRKYRFGAIVVDRIPKSPFDGEPTIIGGGESDIFVPNLSSGVIEIRVRRSREAQNIFNRYIG